jgi:DNA-binding transcriptional MerR regulator
VSTADRPYLSIGEVLGLLLEEFPDVTISKIRFLESQGLIDPERTASGYRKFYDPDVDRLRVILREQRENFLPLRVIRDRLDTGTIDDSGALTPPRGLRNVVPLNADDDDSMLLERPTPEQQQAMLHRHPAAQPAPDASDRAAPRAEPQPTPQARLRSLPSFEPMPTTGGVDTAGQSATSDSSQRAVAVGEIVDDQQSFTPLEICSRAGISTQQLNDLESFGVVSRRGAGNNALYTASDVAIASASGSFLRSGIEARHLRGWRQAAEREAALFEQMVTPLLRQRNPQAREQAAALVSQLSDSGAALRAALLRAALNPLVDRP